VALEYDTIKDFPYINTFKIGFPYSDPTIDSQRPWFRAKLAMHYVRKLSYSCFSGSVFVEKILMAPPYFHKLPVSIVSAIKNLIEKNSTYIAHIFVPCIAQSLHFPLMNSLPKNS
jgi:hypothetical protein